LREKGKALMFAGHDSDKARTTAQEKYARANTARDTNAAPGHNPVWQSLALRHHPSIQPKLSVSQPGDPYEQEADHVAEQVMRAPAPGDDALARSSLAPVTSRQGLTGRPLDQATRSLMEPRFGYDFSRVRTHTDGAAADGARTMRARAYTVGSDIVFAHGEYSPATTQGQRLIAHELAHVVQQSGGVEPQASGHDHVAGEALSSVGPSLQRDAAGGAAPAPVAMEHIAGGLWATDADGNILPPSLDDIAQGGVADCFLFASMAAIVNTNPQNIFNMIEDHGDGSYTVTFKGIGFWSSAKQKVTSEFQVGKHGKVGTRKALWPLIIEKAYIQQKGGLDKVEDAGIHPGSSVKEMINEGPSSFDPREKTKDYIMGKVTEGKEKKWPMTIFSPKKDEASTDKKEIADNTPGVHFWHAYAITDVDAIKNQLKLFNPWGKDHPYGDGWTPVELVRKFFVEIAING
jgi:Domain of unknown function (DUF4157)/Calpain family cysteine protease